MYHGVGRAPGDLVSLSARAAQLPITWNPPGWGSCDARALHDAAIPGAWRLAMVVAIRPGGYIPFHRDDPAAENGLGQMALSRVHLVLTTNPACWSFHDGTWQQLDAGSLYRMDPSREHASINLGETVRLHLVVDREV